MVERQLIISMLISSLFLLLLRLEISLSVPGSLLGSWHLVSNRVPNWFKSNRVLDSS